MYQLIQGYLCRLPGAMKKEQFEDGTTAEFCIYTPHSLRATVATLLLIGTFLQRYITVGNPNSSTGGTADKDGVPISPSVSPTPQHGYIVELKLTAWMSWGIRDCYSLSNASEDVDLYCVRCLAIAHQRHIHLAAPDQAAW